MEGGAGGGAGLLSVDDDDYYNDHFAGGDGGDEDYFQLRDPSHSINPASDALLLMDMPVPFVLNPDNYNDP